MARPRSSDKRAAILDAAIQVFALRGAASAPTSAISAGAGVAEGTLFTYFPTKDVLVNELYCMLKREVAQAMLAGYPRSSDARAGFRHVWDRYVEWGVTQPKKFKVLTQLQVSHKITPKSKRVGNSAFAEIERLATESIRQKRIRNHPLPFLSALMGSLAETTIEFIAHNRKSRTDYRAVGFEILWAGVSHR
jgi:AcrR family transcriptional regulator